MLSRSGARAAGRARPTLPEGGWAAKPNQAGVQGWPDQARTPAPCPRAQARVDCFRTGLVGSLIRRVRRGGA